MIFEDRRAGVQLLALSDEIECSPGRRQLGVDRSWPRAVKNDANDPTETSVARDGMRLDEAERC